MKIGCDYDGVYAHTSQLKSELAKELFGVDIAPEELNELVIERRLLTFEQYKALNVLYKDEHIAMRLKPVDRAIEYAQLLLEKGDVLKIVTWRHGTGLDFAQRLSEQWGLNIPFHGVGVDMSKAQALEGFDIFIDDRIDVLKELIGKVPYLFLFSWKYNEHEDVGEHIRRVANWLEFFEAVNTIRLAKE